MKKPDSDKPGQAGRKYEKSLSLFPLSFTEAVQRIAKAKPIPRKTPKKK
jgi:hypothetical protein